jgi:hypothetical protein
MKSLLIRKVLVTQGLGNTGQKAIIRSSEELSVGASY